LSFYLNTALFAIIYSFGIIVIIYSNLEIVFKPYSLTVFFDDNSFTLKERQVTVKWHEVITYLDTSNSGGFYPSIVLWLKNGKRISISCFRTKNNLEEWQKFSDYFLKVLRKNCPDLKNYYDRKEWDFLVYFSYIILIITPVILILVNAKPVYFFSVMLGVAGFSIRTITSVRGNRKSQKQYKTYKEIQEEKMKQQLPGE